MMIMMMTIIDDGRRSMVSRGKRRPPWCGRTQAAAAVASASAALLALLAVALSVRTRTSALLPALAERGAGLSSPKASQPPSSNNGEGRDDDDDGGRGSRMCRAPNLTFSAPPELSASSGTVVVTLPVDYQCRGEAYENYTRSVLRPYAHRLSSSSSPEPPLWGRRAFPLPDRSSVLVVGNSHAKQVVLAVLCQHSASVRTVRHLGPPTDFMRPPDLAVFWEATFANGASLVVLGNHPLAYSTDWPGAVRRLDPRRRKLSDYGAVVLGQTNRYEPRHANTNFFVAMVGYQRRHPDLSIDVERNPGPSLPDLASLYGGPIVALPMFSGPGAAWAEAATAEARRIRLKHNRSNVRVLHTRRHILETGTECGSTGGRASVGTCAASPGAHRCTGPSGGDADLVAWDLVEALHGAIE